MRTTKPGPAYQLSTTCQRHLDGEMTELALALHCEMLANPEARARYAEIYGTEWQGFDHVVTLSDEVDLAFSRLASFDAAGVTGIR